MQTHVRKNPPGVNNFCRWIGYVIHIYNQKLSVDMLIEHGIPGICIGHTLLVRPKQDLYGYTL